MSVLNQKQQIEADSKARLRLWIRLLDASRSVESVLRENMRTQFDSTLPRFDVMAALDHFPKGLKMSELSKELRVSNGNVTVIVERLVENGFVVREAVLGDRRAMRVRLTKKGEDEFHTQAKVHETWVSDLLADVSPKLAIEMAELLKHVSDNPSKLGQSLEQDIETKKAQSCV